MNVWKSLCLPRSETHVNFLYAKQQKFRKQIKTILFCPVIISS